MKPKDVANGGEEELTDIKKFHYAGNQFLRLDGDDDYEEIEAGKKRKAQKLADSREIWLEATAEEVCFRCLENRNKKVSVKGLEFCPEYTCGTRNPAYKK